MTDIIAIEFGEPLPAWIEIRNVADTAYQKLLEATLDAGEAAARRGVFPKMGFCCC